MAVSFLCFDDDQLPAWNLIFALHRSVFACDGIGASENSWRHMVPSLGVASDRLPACLG
jgi:hypothetical protein